MQLPCAHVLGRLSTVFLVGLLLAWTASVEAMPPVRQLASLASWSGFQDEEEEYADEEYDSGEEEYADEEDDSGEEEYADGEEDSGEEEYADGEEDSGEEEYADGEEDSGEEEYADGDEDSGEEEYADGEEDLGEEEYADGEEDSAEDDPEAYAEEDDTELLEDYEDDSWAIEVAEDESDDAIPIDDETWGEDVVWEVVEIEEVDGSGSIDADTEESDEDSVGAGELMVVRTAKRSPSTRPGPRPAPRPGPRPSGSSDDDEDTPYSYGGRPVTALSVPWQAEIFNPKVKPATADSKPTWQRQHYCGGALIARDWVLTAAHCIDQQLVDHGFKVRLGMTDLSKGDGLTYRIDRIVRHSQYNAENNDPARPPNMYANDIALIRIVDDGPPRQRDPKRIREIPLNRKPLKPGVPVSATGWGVTGTGAADAASSVILRVDLQLMDTQVCQSRPKFGPQKIHGNVFCAAHPQRSTCRGDSGGPVVLTNESPVLVGVVSWGKKKCAGDGRPGVYTRIDRYLDWIDQAMKLPPNRTALP